MAVKNQNPLNISIKNIGIESLKPYANNAKTHSEKQISQIANSIKQFGFLNPVIIDNSHQIVAGHGRVEAARYLQIKEIPTILADNLSEDEIRAYIIADNKIAQNAGWDLDILTIELQHLSQINTNFDIEITGFSTPEIDVLLDINESDIQAKEDEISEIDISKKAITQLGDLWLLGNHRLICGDATNKETYNNLMGNKKAHMVFTDPPYNVPIDGHVCGAGNIKHREFSMASGEMSEEQFTEFLEKTFSHLIENTSNGSLHYVCMDWRHVLEIMNAARKHYSDYKNLCVWSKNNGGMGSLYRSQHELVFVFKNGKGRHLNNVELGKNGRYRTNVWSYAGVNTFKKDRLNELSMHPTVKPVALVADAIKDCTKRGELLLDPFSGSGTSLIAAEKTGRLAYCIEIDPLYCDLIIQRWERYTGRTAINSYKDTSFEELTKQAEVL